MPPQVICDTCNKKFGSIQILNHKSECLKNYFKMDSGYLIQFKTRNYYSKIYIIYAIIGLECNFQDIDNFLQEIWNYKYNESEFYIFKNEKHEIFKHELVRDYKPKTEIYFNYKIDSVFDNYFKCDINITCNIITKLKGKEKNTNINIVFQNDIYPIICFICQKTASHFIDTCCICDYCSLIYFNNLNNLYTDYETDYHNSDDETIYTDVDDNYQDNENIDGNVSLDYIINKVKLKQIENEHTRYRLKRRKNELEYREKRKIEYRPMYESDSESEDEIKHDSYEEYMKVKSIPITNSPHIIVNATINYDKL